MPVKELMCSNAASLQPNTLLIMNSITSIFEKFLSEMPTSRNTLRWLMNHIDEPMWVTIVSIKNLPQIFQLIMEMFCIGTIMKLPQIKERLRKMKQRFTLQGSKRLYPTGSNVSKLYGNAKLHNTWSSRSTAVTTNYLKHWSHFLPT